MAERWISTGRKYCEICKVWFGDNKASIEFHERGEKHKNALAQKLRDVSRNREKKLQAEISMQGTLAAMEQGAYLSSKKHGDGVQEGPSLPATGIQRTYFDPRQHTDVTAMAKEMAQITDHKRNGEYRRPDGPSGPVPIKVNREALQKAQKHQEKLAGHRARKQAKLQQELDEKKKAVAAAAEAKAKEKLWVEAATEDGQTYYWHMYSGETAWAPPGPYYTPIEYEIFLAQLEADKEIKHNFALAEIEQREVQEAMEQGDLPQGYEANYYRSEEPVASDYLLDIREQRVKKARKTNRAPKRAHDSTILPENLVGLAVPFTRPEISTRMNEVDDINTIPLPVCDPGSSDLKTEAEEIPEEKPEVLQYAIPDPEPEREVSVTTGIGGWTKVAKKIEKEEPFFSPLTARYRELEEQEKKEAAELAAGKKAAEEKEPKVEFTEKVAAVKKVKGVVEFKKRAGGTKNVRKREQ